MKVLLATNHLFGWTGSEIQLSLVDSVLRDAGCSTLLYADFTSGPFFVERLFEFTSCTSVLQDLTAWVPDIAYVQHHSVAVQVRACFPELPIIHAQLGVLPHLERAPRLDVLPSACLAISEEVSDACIRERNKLCFEETDITIFRNIIDDIAFSPIGESSDLKALVLYSYKLDSVRLNAIAGASDVLGINIAAASHESGSFPYANAPDVLRMGEVVVASGRGAIEAMLCGKVPLIMANCGDDGLVTPDNFHDLMRVNFSGRFTSRNLTTDDVVVEILRYKKQYGLQLRELALEYFGKSRRAHSILDLFAKYSAVRPRAFSQQQMESIHFTAETYSLQREFSRSEAWFRSQASEKAHQTELRTRDQRILEMEKTISGMKGEMLNVEAQVDLLTESFGVKQFDLDGRPTADRL